MFIIFKGAVHPDFSVWAEFLSLEPPTDIRHFWELAWRELYSGAPRPTYLFYSLSLCNKAVKYFRLTPQLGFQDIQKQIILVLLQSMPKFWLVFSEPITKGGNYISEGVYRTPPGCHIVFNFTENYIAADWKGEVIFHNIQL